MSCRLVFKNPTNREGHGCSSLAMVALFLLIFFLFLSLSFFFFWLFCFCPYECLFTLIQAKMVSSVISSVKHGRKNMYVSERGDSVYFSGEAHSHGPLIMVVLVNHTVSQTWTFAQMIQWDSLKEQHHLWPRENPSEQHIEDHGAASCSPRALSNVLDSLESYVLVFCSSVL